MLAPKAYSYVRFSTPEQARGDSLRRQVDAARSFAVSLGLSLDESLRDLGRSAFSGAHRTKGALGAFLREVESGTVPRGSILIVESLDRLSREQVLDALEQFRSILKAGVEIATLSDGQRYTEESVRKDFTQLLVSLLVMSRAYEESARKAERVGAAWGQKRKRAEGGEAMTRACVAWCRVVGEGRDSRYELIPDRADVVRRIFHMTAGGMGRRQIVRALNSEGVPSFGRSSGWQDSYVAKILSNRAAIGLYQPHRLVDGRRVPEGEELRGYYPPAVSEADFHLARSSTIRRQGGGGRQGKGVSNLLSGLARCGACGATMVHLNKGDPPKGGRYLFCDRKRRGLACDNPRPSVRYEIAESLVILSVKQINLNAILQGNHATDEAPEDEMARLEERCRLIATQIDALLEAFGTAPEVPQVGERVIRLGVEQREIMARLENLAELIGQQRAEAGMDWRARYEALMDRLDTSGEEDIADVRSALAQEIKRCISAVVFLGDEMSVKSRVGQVIFNSTLAGLPSPLANQLVAMEKARRHDLRVKRLKDDGGEDGSAL